MKLHQYELVTKINEGGSGVIYKSVDTHTGALVAIKVLNKSFHNNTTALNKFQFEANQYLYLQHPNIVRLIDFNIKDQPYLVMEFVEGMNLEEYINKITGPISNTKAVFILNQLLNAMDFAHSNNVLHLDIKPSNIMINNQQQIKLLDFGISKNTEDEDEKMFIGSPYYMSPEQVSQEGIDKTSDIYSIGITYYQMVTGQLPFSKTMNKEEVFTNILWGILEKPSDRYPPLSKNIENIILKATHVNKKKRYVSCADFKDSLNQNIN